MRLFVYSNLFIAVSAALITHETSILLGTEADWSPLFVLVFSATLLVYNLDRISDTSSEDDIDATVRHDWIEQRRTLLWSLTAIAALGVVGTLFFLSFDVILATLPLGLFALGYSLPVVAGGSGPRRLKDIAGLKMVLIVVVWTGATVLLPAVENLEQPLRADVLWTAAERAIFIFAITLPFDVRDLERDRAAGLRTIPMLLGVERSRYLAVGTVALFAVMAGLHHGFAPGAAGAPLVVSALVTGGLLLRADRDRPEMYYVGQLDGMIALQWLLVAGWDLLAG